MHAVACVSSPEDNLEHWSSLLSTLFRARSLFRFPLLFVLGQLAQELAEMFLSWPHIAQYATVWHT